MIYNVLGSIIYVVVALLFGMTLNLLSVEQIGTGDDDYDEAMLDNKIRFFAIFLISIMWVITLPILIIINILNKGEVKND